MHLPARSRRLRCGVAVLTAVALLSGCTSSSTDDGDPTVPVPDTEATNDTPQSPTASPSTTPQPSDPASPTPTADPDTAQEPSRPAEDVATACDSDERAALTDVVGTQLAAFATGDFAAARELTSATFRAGVDVAAFEQLITEQYPVVLAGGEPTFGACIVGDSNGVVAVALPGPDGPVDLVYLLTGEGGAWRIDGAQYADEAGGTTSTPGTPV